MWLIAFLLLPLAGLAYAGWHVHTLLPLAAPWRWAAVAVLVVAVLSIFANFTGLLERLPLSVATAVYEVGTSAIFVLLYLVMLFLVLDLLTLVHVLPRAWLHGNGWMAAAVAALMVVVFVAGNGYYHHKVRRELSATTDKPLERDLRIVMLSDLHLGYHNGRAELARWVSLINAEKPDLVFIGGDIIDISVRPLVEEGMAEELRRIDAPVYACLGNHEYFSGEPRAAEFYKEANIHLLRDSVATAAGLTIVGRDDRTNTHRQSLGALMRQADTSRYTVLLDHQPYHLEQAERAGIDFQLSGHTHHGQVWPISWVTDALYECAFGSHQRGRTRYYVTSGMGIWGGKFRIGTCSEYVVLTLSRAK